MRWLDIRQLKNLRRFPVPPEILAAGRVKLIAVIEASPMSRRPSAWFLSAAWRPVMAAMVVVVVVATGGGTVAAAHGSLPGDRFYVVKLAAEGLSERMAFAPERRFVVQAAHAERRLEETERLLERSGLVAEERVTRVREAMDLYESHLFAMNEIVVKLEVDPEKPEKGKKAVAAAEGMLDRHVRLIESATQAEPFVASLMLRPIDDTFMLEADMFAAIPADDGGKDEGRERRGRERAERIDESLKRFRAGLEKRRSRERSDDGKDERRSEAEGTRDREASDDGSEADRDDDRRDGDGPESRREIPLEIRLGM